MSVLSEVLAVVLSEVCGRTFRRRSNQAVLSEVSAAVLSWECGAYVL